MNNDAEKKAQNWTLAPGDAPGAVTLAGEIDFSVTPAVRERLLALIGDTPETITLDMADLSYIDSSGLALLIELRKHLAESGRKVTIRSLSPQVRKLFNLTQLGDLFGLPPG
uniref:Anti-sigma factor antagonist n=1 Tax=Desulfovibrio sp. U5L TaxID=596152 RepID=I2PX84_9BACT